MFRPPVRGAAQPMAWCSNDRRARPPSNWRALRAEVLKRDGFMRVAILRDTGAPGHPGAVHCDGYRRGPHRSER